jgi:predicted XRE-type DNA-binding protein
MNARSNPRKKSSGPVAAHKLRGGEARHAIDRTSSPLEDDVVETTTGNIFEDLGLTDPQTRLEKAELARVIRKAVSAAGWKQREAATHLGIAQSDVSDLVRGKLGRFSVDRLRSFLVRLGFDVRIHVGQHANAEAHPVETRASPARQRAQETGAPAVPSAARRSTQLRWEEAAPGISISRNSLAVVAKWRAAPDLSRARHAPAALYRVPIQPVLALATTTGGTAVAGPFVYVHESLRAALSDHVSRPVQPARRAAA